MIDKTSIDFVVLWVDGSDPDWLEDFSRHAINHDGDKRKSRYRDWNNLKYMFRSFEKCTPWIRKIHFVTYGHLPDWLNTGHEKLNIVKHADFIEEKYLPVFSSRPIEIHMHRIFDLADKFVYFNDDMFILRNFKPEQFFKNNFPRDMFAFNIVFATQTSHAKLNNVRIIHRYFDKFKVVKKNFFKIFNVRSNLIEVLKTILLMPWSEIVGFQDHHMPQPFLKKTFQEVWDAEPEILNKTSASKVRTCSDVNQYLFRYWHLCKGEFLPVSFRRKRSYEISNYDDAVNIYDKLISRKYSIISINDEVSDVADFVKIRDKVNEAFEQIFPEKSEFEK